MTMQTLGGPILYPISPAHLNNTAGTSNYVIDASGEKIAFIFKVPKTGTISSVGFLTGTVTDSQTLRVTLQTVDATTGSPTGTDYGGSAAGTVATPAATTLYLCTLGTAATATKGDVVAAVVEFDSTAGNLQILSYNSSSASMVSFPYLSHYTTSWAKQKNTPNFGIKYNDGTYGQIPGAAFGSANVAQTFASDTAIADEVGNQLVIPFKCRAAGIFANVDADNACDLVLYNSAGTVLASVTLDSDYRAGTDTGIQNHYFATAQELAAGTYYVTVKPTTTSAVSLRYVDLYEAAAREAWFGDDVSYCFALDESYPPTADTDRLAHNIGIIIDQLDDGAGGGSGGFPASSQLNGVLQ